jgi:hypothetical protein
VVSVELPSGIPDDVDGPDPYTDVMRQDGLGA